MPKLSSNGTRWISGVAGAGFYSGIFAPDDHGVLRVVPTVAISSAGGHAWYDDEYAITQQFGDKFGGAVVTAIKVATQQETILRHFGANDGGAGGGVWTAFFKDGLRIYHGLRENMESAIHLPDAGLGPVGPDGAVWVKDAFHSSGPHSIWEKPAPGQDAYDPALRWRVTDTDAFGILMLGNRRVIFYDQWGNWHSRGGAPIPQHVNDWGWWLNLLEIDGRWLQIYQDAGTARLIAHFHGETEGWVIDNGPSTYRVSAVRLADGRVRVLWAVSSGEVWHDLRFRDLDLAEARQTLSVLAPKPVPVPQPAPTPEPKPEPKPEEPPVSQQKSPNLLHVVKRVADKYPWLLKINTFASCGEFMVTLVPELNAEDPAGDWCLLSKDPGEYGANVTLPDGRVVRVSHDVTVSRARGEQFDCLGYAAANSHDNTGLKPGDPDYVEPGPATVDFHFIDPQYYRPGNLPVPVSTGTQPQPQPQPGPQPQPQPELAAKVAELEKQMAGLAGQASALGDQIETLGSVLESAIRAFQGQIKELEKGAFSIEEAREGEQGAVKLDTSHRLGHGHRLWVRLRRG